MLADLKMPGSLEAIDAILSEIDGGRLGATDAMSRCSVRRSTCGTTAGWSGHALVAVAASRRFRPSTSPSSRRSSASRSRACTNSVHRAQGERRLLVRRSGQDHLAISLAIATAASGRRVYYGTLTDLIRSLEDAQAAGQLSRRLAVLTHPALLIVDEIGYLPVSHTGAVLFFQLMNRRYERASTILTSNKGSRNGAPYSADEVMAAALIDRCCITATWSTSAATASGCGNTRPCTGHFRTSPTPHLRKRRPHPEEDLSNENRAVGVCSFRPPDLCSFNRR